MLSAYCSTVSPTTWSTCFACSYLRRCAQHRSKRCAFSCSRSGHASAKQLVASAFTWPAAGFFRISSKPSATPLRLSRRFDNTLSPKEPGGAISKNSPRGQNNRNPPLYKGRLRSVVLSSVSNVLSALRFSPLSGVEVWRGGLGKAYPLADPFVCRCLTSHSMPPFPHPAHRT